MIKLHTHIAQAWTTLAIVLRYKGQKVNITATLAYYAQLCSALVGCLLIMVCLWFVQSSSSEASVSSDVNVSEVTDGALSQLSQLIADEHVDNATIHAFITVIFTSVSDICHQYRISHLISLALIPSSSHVRFCVSKDICTESVQRYYENCQLGHF